MNKVPKEGYILDECIIRHAANLENKKGGFDEAAAKVIFDIYANCDYLVVSYELLRKYDNHISELTKQGNSGSNLIKKILKEFLSNKKKLQTWNDVDYTIPHEEKVPDSDKYLIRLAKLSKANLVTSDDRLIEKLHPDTEGFIVEFGITVYKPRQVSNKIAASYSELNIE